MGRRSDVPALFADRRLAMGDCRNSLSYSMPFMQR
jgi:hypothetical protein